MATSSVEALRLYQGGGGAARRLRAGRDREAARRHGEGPELRDGLTRLAEAHANAGEQREAESAAERAQTLAEKAPLPLAQRYQIHAAVATVKEDLETAAKSYRELAALYPEDPDVQYRLAATLRGLGQQPEAIAAYQKVVQLSPGYGAAEIELWAGAQVAGRAARKKRSARCRRRSATSRFKDDTEALGMIHSILGIAYRDTAQLDKALESLQPLARLPPQGGRQARPGGDAHQPRLGLRVRPATSPKALAAEKQGARGSRARCSDRAQESFVLHNMGMTYYVGRRPRQALAQAFRDSLQIEMERGNACRDREPPRQGRPTPTA